ncbi:MAG: exonuclease domain-containing protein [Limnobacter sp.]|nr:exonuclease domain-containing protein [Limnobacter sp.]
MLSFRPDKAIPPAQQSDSTFQARFKRAGELAQDEHLARYYRDTLPLIEELHELRLEDAELVSLDLETTGLNAEVDDILSIGLVHMNSQAIRYGTRKQWLLKPVAKLRADSISIHGITHSEVEQAPDLLEVLPEFLDELAGKIVLVHCASIEESFLDVAIRYRLGEGFLFPTLDTMGLARRIAKSETGGFFRLFRKSSTSHSLRLADQRNLYGLPFYPPHEAVTDALATGELLLAMIQKQELGHESVSELLKLR